MPIPIKGTISGSRAATVLGLNKYQTPFEVWQRIMEELYPGHNEKCGYETPTDPDNAAIRWGSAFESAHIAMLPEMIKRREATFSRTLDCGAVLSCHVDGMVDGINGSKLFEAKTTSMRAYRSMWTNDKIPQNYMIQVQHNMYLTGAKEALVSVMVFPETPDYYEGLGWEIEGSYLVRGEERVHMNKWARAFRQMGYIKSYRIDRDDSLIEMMLDKYGDFWEKYVLTATPPGPINVDDIKRRYPEPVGTMVIEDEGIIELFAEYKDIKKETGAKGSMTKRAANIKVALLGYAAANGATEDEDSSDKWVFRGPDGHKLGTWSKNKNGNFIFKCS